MPEEKVIAKLELVSAPEDSCCSQCVFQGESCLVREVLPCEGGYWRLNSQ